MAKDDPMAKARKAQKQKDKKRNKDARDKARDAKAVKQDSRGLESTVRRLEEAQRAGTISENETADLARLTKELEHVKKAKADYVAAHPDSKVYHVKGKTSTGSKKASADTKRLFGKNGLPLNPERSIYYDPQFNPTGMPPPGQPYKEKETTPEPEAESEGQGEEEEDDDEDEEDEDDIIMPEGPPPGASTADPEDSDDSIIMPAGPPPGSKVSPPRPSMISSGPVSYSAPAQPAASTSALSSTHPLPEKAAASSAAVETPSKPAAPLAQATISAAPQLRDLKKEATTFVPTALKRKRPQQQQQRQQPQSSTGIPVQTTQSVSPDQGQSPKKARVEDVKDEEGHAYEPLEGFDG